MLSADLGRTLPAFNGWLIQLVQYLNEALFPWKLASPSKAEHETKKSVSFESIRYDPSKILCIKTTQAVR